MDSGGQRLSLHRFRHILFQKYLYHSLDEAERVFLHEAAGRELKQNFAGQMGEVAGQLARHFQAAGLIARAITYLHQTGKRPMRLSANEEAIANFNRGLTLLKTLPDTPYTWARELCHQLGDTTQLFSVLMGLWGFHIMRFELQTARDLAEQCLHLAQGAQRPARLIQAHYALGDTLYFM